MIGFAIAEFAREAYCECAGLSPNRETIALVVKSIGEHAERSAQRAADGRPIACKEGCSHCCHMRVVATVPEVIAVANFIARHFLGDAVEATRKRVIETDEKTRGLSDEQWGVAHHACPLLVDGKCSVYAARPLDCRGYNSTDVDACRAAARDYLDWQVPMDGALTSAFKSAQAGILQALTGTGHQPRLVEMTAALRVIFEDPLAIGRWLGGENPFAGAELDSSDPEQRAFLPWVPSDELRAAAAAEDSE